MRARQTARHCLQQGLLLVLPAQMTRGVLVGGLLHPPQQVAIASQGPKAVSQPGIIPSYVEYPGPRSNTVSIP